jgi:hypothetical protein
LLAQPESENARRFAALAAHFFRHIRC